MFIEDEEYTQEIPQPVQEEVKVTHARLSLTKREKAILKRYMNENMMTRSNLFYTNVIKREIELINRDLEYGL
tara:strand:+ start:4255 stop:4473 length:219 start_codon:yes stop_codon:yes gene_type:complete